ncbi:MAG: hypothetical protein QOG15_195 [Solirubrobacteraceae bacterium]|nr:hypothetical protein [Solirubrobacteraceae bacterium]
MVTGAQLGVQLGARAPEARRRVPRICRGRGSRSPRVHRGAAVAAHEDSESAGFAMLFAVARQTRFFVDDHDLALGTAGERGRR